MFTLVILQIAEQRLAQFDCKDDSCNRAVKVVKDAVVEIQSGLFRSVQMSDVKSVVQPLVSATVVQALKLLGHCPNNVCIQFESLTAGFPLLNLQFVVELVLECEWMDLLMQVKIYFT